MNEALAILDEDDEMLANVQEVTVFPPLNACVDITDEDSVKEDIVQFDDLLGSQLRSPSEIKPPVTFHQMTILHCRIVLEVGNTCRKK